MIIEVDLNLLYQYELSANQYVLAYMLFKQDYHNFTRFLAVLTKKVAKADLSMLESKRYISNLNEDGNLEPGTIVVRNKLTTMFKEEKDEFEELLELYPIKVLRPDGTKDYLRTDLKRCKKMYLQVLGASKTRHKTIMNALKFELKVREQEGNMK